MADIEYTVTPGEDFQNEMTEFARRLATIRDKRKTTEEAVKVLKKTEKQIESVLASAMLSSNQKTIHFESIGKVTRVKKRYPHFLKKDKSKVYDILKTNFGADFMIQENVPNKDFRTWWNDRESVNEAKRQQAMRDALDSGDMRPVHEIERTAGVENLEKEFGGLVKIHEEDSIRFTPDKKK